jgi:hypothetical protein
MLYFRRIHMKKALLIITCVSAVPVIAAKPKRMPIETLQWGLCLTFWEPKIWGSGEDKRDPRKEARAIHERLVAAVEVKRCNNKKVNFESIGKSRDKKYDAIIVHQCAVLEKRKRQTGSVGFIRVADPFYFNFPTKFDAENFCNNACSFDDFYQSLTDDELDQLIKGTQPRNVMGRLWNKLKGNEAYRK